MRRVLEIGVPAAVLVVLALVPKLSLDIPVVFNGPLSSPGTLQLLARLGCDTLSLAPVKTV